MRPHWIAVIAGAAMLAPGCQEAPKAPPEAVPVAKPAPADAPAKPAATKAPAKPVAAKPPAKPVVAKAPPKPVAAKTTRKAGPAARPAGKLVTWDAPIAWMDWDAGLARAKKDNKPIMLMVFADW